MCFLKNLNKSQSVQFQKEYNKTDPFQLESINLEQNVLLLCPTKQASFCWTFDQQKLINLFQIIQKNNSIIESLNKSINGNSEYLEKISTETENYIKKSTQTNSQHVEVDEFDSMQNSTSELFQKLFGTKKYKYSLKLSQLFPQTIYKQRNFNVLLNVVDLCGKNVRNNNILNLCLSVCSSDGQWIHENRVGQPFLKGKTEVELYKGEASFEKIYARDVSRAYPDGKVNLVIYAKPSAILYSGSNSYEQHINSQQIRPLIIQHVLIKAKKKQ